MSRFFCQAQNIFQDKIVITEKKEIHHILDVLRLKTDDKVVCFDGKAREFMGQIVSSSAKKITIEIKKIIRLKDDESLKIALACAIPKKAKMDYIVEKTTELGVHKIIPLKTRRTIVELDRQRAISRINHWRRIALNAAKQAVRIDLPIIEPIMLFKDVLSFICQYDLAVIANLSDKGRYKFKDIPINPKHKNILIFIGPEGDFTPEELTLAKKAGCISVSLGNLILKVDTAAIAVVAFLKLIRSN